MHPASDSSSVKSSMSTKVTLCPRQSPALPQGLTLSARPPICCPSQTRHPCCLASLSLRLLPSIYSSSGRRRRRLGLIVRPGDAGNGHAYSCNRGIGDGGLCPVGIVLMLWTRAPLRVEISSGLLSQLTAVSGLLSRVGVFAILSFASK